VSTTNGHGLANGTTFFQHLAEPLISLGIPVIPLRPKTKAAFLSTWQNLASTNREQIAAWGKEYPDANVGSVAKEIGAAWFFEIDSLDVAARIETETGHKIFDLHTLMVKSRPGRGHFYFKQNDRSIAMGNITQNFVKHNDWSARVSNQYVVGPGSIHPETGEPYSILKNAPIAEAPDWLIDWLISQKISDTPMVPAEKVRLGEPQSFVYTEEERREFRSVDVSREGPKIPHGAHDNTLTRICGKLHWLHPDWSKQGLADELAAVCEARCENYGSDYKEMCEKIAHSIGKRPVKTDVFAEDMAARAEQAKQAQEAIAQPKAVDVSNWRSKFRNIAEMDQGDPVMIIEGVLQDGTCFLGAAPGHGKTLVALAIAKSVTLGTPLFESPQYKVKEQHNVIYLIPETSDRPFRKRCEAFRLPADDRFIARTITQGSNLKLTDPDLLEAVRQLKPVVILDTARRFNTSSDTNSDAENQKLVNNITELRAAGAACVIILHHATKAANQKKQAMTLENMLSGTGDFGAMCDQAYGIRMDESLYSRGSGPMEIEIVNLKDRERVGGLSSLRLAATYTEQGSIFPRSWIDETGNFRAVGDTETVNRNTNTLVSLVQAHPEMTITELVEETGIKKYTVQQTLKGLGWHRVKGGAHGSSPWHQDVGGQCPYGKPESQPAKVHEEEFSARF
jgi:hypothetical protein